MKKTWEGTSLRAKLILLFIVIKVVPLLLLGWIACQQSVDLADHLVTRIKSLVQVTDKAGHTAISHSVKALEAFVRDDIERQTTDVAQSIANFLYERDADILYIRTQKPDEFIYKQFIDSRRKNLIYHNEWKLTEDGKSWEPINPIQESKTIILEDNELEKDFHYRPPTVLNSKNTPLYHEITFVGLDGREQIKITTSNQVSSELKDISIRQNTYAKAETYFEELKKLQPGEIYVSEVIGSYVGSKIIGPYTPDAAAKKGIPFSPQDNAYAGKENPVGKRFKGIIRWATPVSQNGKIIGWVTLALNHDHLMQFTNTIVSTSERYSDINDASGGNYAFIIDNKGRVIAHPRHHSIVGYDPKTGEPAIPWMEKSTYDKWKASELSLSEFIKTKPVNSSSTHIPTEELTLSGNLGLDCRLFNFSKQCYGLKELESNGGSVSFQNLWDGIWKLIASSTIPYYTGQYNPNVSQNKKGFGIIGIGLNLDHLYFKSNAAQIHFNKVISQTKQIMDDEVGLIEETINEDTTKSLMTLSILTLVMIGIVILIAIWMGIYLIRRIKWLNDGCYQFQSGNYKFRFDVKVKDEITNLADSFNDMANTLDEKIVHLKNEINTRTQKESELKQIKDNLEILVEERTQELSKANEKLLSEIEVRKLAEEKAQYLAGHDALTGVANRYLFHERLEQAVYQARRSGKAGALLFFDLDRFKQINDTLGHATGDALLVHVAKTLKEGIRKTDTVARLGGDEFAVIITDLAAADDAAILAEKLLSQFRKSVLLNGYELHVHTSIGITTFDGQNTDIDQILSQSDIAMYQAKTEGGTHFQFFEESMQNKIQARKQLESELQTGLEQQQFLPYFQPIFDYTQRRVVSMEVLLRWDHPELGMTTPAEFIDVATTSGFLTEIDKQVIEKACLQAKVWHDNGIEFGRISINVLPEKISFPDFVDNIKEILDRTKLPASKIALEITERALLADRDQVRDNLCQLQQLGAIIYIDDFGVEYSSLQRLIEYHIDVLKVDRFFVRRIGDPKAEAVIQAITSIANSIGMQIIVEGVETEKQLDYLLKHNCHIIQGYLHARPLAGEDATEHLLKYSPQE